MKVLIMLLLFAAPLLAQDSLLVVGDGMAIFLPAEYTKANTRTVGKVDVNGPMIVMDPTGAIVDTLPAGFDARIQGTRELVRKCPVRSIVVTLTEKTELRGIDLWLDLDGLVPLSYGRGSKLREWFAAANLKDGAKFSMATAKAVTFSPGDTLVVIQAVEIGKAAVKVSRAYGDEKSIGAILDANLGLINH